MSGNVPRPVLFDRQVFSLELTREINYVRSRRGHEYPKWPRFCFFPNEHWERILGSIDSVGDKIFGGVPELPFIGTWHFNQGIYRFSPQLMSALQQTRIPDTIPVEVFHRLPEWCIYVETPRETWGGARLYGFYARLEWSSAGTELRFLLDCEGGFDVFQIQINENNLLVVELAGGGRHAEISRLIPSLLYLCSEDIKIINEIDPDLFPNNPKPKRTENGRFLFPPKASCVWHVGDENSRSGEWDGELSDNGERFYYAWVESEKNKQYMRSTF